MYNGNNNRAYSLSNLLRTAAYGTILAAALVGCGDKKRRNNFPPGPGPAPVQNTAPTVADPVGNNGQIQAGSIYEVNVLASDDVLPTGSSLEGRLFGGANDPNVSISKLNETTSGSTRNGSWIFRYTSPANDTAGQKRFTFEVRDGDLSGVRDIYVNVTQQATGGGGSGGQPGTSTQPAGGAGGSTGQPGTGQRNP